MKTSARLPMLLVLVVLMHDLVHGEDGEIQPAELSSAAQNETDTISPVIERSSYHHPHVITSHHHEEPSYQGFWKKKFVWRLRWVKTWKEKKIYVAVWKRMWGPAEVKEWVPVPRPPPGWLKPSRGNYFIKTHH